MGELTDFEAIAALVENGERLALLGLQMKHIGEQLVSAASTFRKMQEDLYRMYHIYESDPREAEGYVAV